MGALHQIIGHEASWAFLTQLLKTRRFPAAVLLAGPPMVGKTTILEQCARYILCQEGTSCQRCESCRMAIPLHPDVLRFIPTEDTELRNTVATLLRRLHERPSFAPRLVAFLENVDRYSPAASALLLKAIEDVPTHAHLFLTAESIERVPETIRSRTLVRNLAPLPIRELADALTRSGLPTDVAQTHALLSGGRPGLARRFETHHDLKEQYLRWHHALKQLHALPLAERSALATECDDRDTAEELLNVLQGLLRDHIRAIVHGGWQRITAFLPVLRRSREAVSMLRANVPPRLALEYVFFLPEPL